MKTRRSRGGFLRHSTNPPSSTGLTLRIIKNNSKNLKTPSTKQSKNFNPLYNPSSKLETAEVVATTVPNTFNQIVIGSTARNPVYSASSTESRGSASSTESRGSASSIGHFSSNPFTKKQINLTKTNGTTKQSTELTSSSRQSTDSVNTLGINTLGVNTLGVNTLGVNTTVVPPSIYTPKNRNQPKLSFKQVSPRRRGGKRPSKTRKQRKNRK